MLTVWLPTCYCLHWTLRRTTDPEYKWTLEWSMATVGWETDTRHQANTVTASEKWTLLTSLNNSMWKHFSIFNCIISRHTIQYKHLIFSCFNLGSGTIYHQTPNTTTPHIWGKSKNCVPSWLSLNPIMHQCRMLISNSDQNTIWSHDMDGAVMFRHNQWLSNIGPLMPTL